MEVIKYNPLTPVLILETKLGIPQDYKQKCIEEIYRLGDSMNQTTNVKAIMSSYTVWEETKILDILLNNILKTIENKIISSYLDIPAKANLNDAWSAIYKKGHYTQSHHHIGNFPFSFVYYLQAANNTPLIFSGSTFGIYPSDDTLVVFPSTLLHEVPMHEDEIDRICVAGNVSLNKSNV